jgi:hypothetical protein
VDEQLVGRCAIKWPPAPEALSLANLHRSIVAGSSIDAAALLLLLLEAVYRCCQLVMQQATPTPSTRRQNDSRSPGTHVGGIAFSR